MNIYQKEEIQTKTLLTKQKVNIALNYLLEGIYKDVGLENNTFIIITHYFKILEYIDVDTVYVMKDGEVKATWDVELARKISESGFWEI